HGSRAIPASRRVSWVLLLPVTSATAPHAVALLRCCHLVLDHLQTEKPEQFYRPTQALSLIVCSGTPIKFRSLYSGIGRNPQECAAHRVTRFPSQTVEQAATVVVATREKYRATLRPLPH